MIVVDVGCKSHGGEESIPALCDLYHPELLLGYDPYPELEEGVSTRWWSGGKTLVLTHRAAAWTHNGSVNFAFDGTRSRIGTGQGSRPVRSFDLASFVDLLAGPVVVKLDVEGAEYTLLERFIVMGLDARLAAVHVEWHTASVDYDERSVLARKRSIVAAWSRSCPLLDWPVPAV